MEVCAKISNSENLFQVSYFQLSKVLCAYFNQNLSAKLSEFFHLHPQLTNPINSNAWPGKVPNAEQEGMYFLFDAYEHLIFIGYANNGIKIQDHLDVLFSYNQKDGSCVVNGDAWPSIPCYLVTLPLKDGGEAHSIREYLMESFPELPNVRVNVSNAPMKKTYPLWQYGLAIASVPFLVVVAIIIAGFISHLLLL